VEQVSHVVTTADGRSLTVHEGGDRNGVPMLAHFGTPGSSLLYEPHLRDAEERAAVDALCSRVPLPSAAVSGLLLCCERGGKRVIRPNLEEHEGDLLDVLALSERLGSRIYCDLGSEVERVAESPRRDRRERHRPAAELVGHHDRPPIARGEKLGLPVPSPTPDRPDRVDHVASG
jgi:hypothetical protein